MAQNNENSPANLWARRSKYVTCINRSQHPLTEHAINSSSRLSLSTNTPDRDNHDRPSANRFGSLGAHGRHSALQSAGPITASAVASPTGSGSSAFGLGTGAFGFGSTGKTPKTPGATFDISKKESSDESGKDTRRPNLRKSQSSLRTPSSAIEAPLPSTKETPGAWPLKNGWIMYYRPPTGKNSDYEKSIKPLAKFESAQSFWTLYTHLKRPSNLPTVSDYHIFKDGIRPVWEDEENKKGGKWTMRLKKGVADRYWEKLLLAMIGDQFAEAGEEVCGAVVSVRSGEDVFSIWTKNDGGRNIKIRETIKRVLDLPADTNLQWRSHDDSITQRQVVDQARQDKANQDKRRNTLVAEKPQPADEAA